MGIVSLRRASKETGISAAAIRRWQKTGKLRDCYGILWPGAPKGSIKAVDLDELEAKLNCGRLKKPEKKNKAQVSLIDKSNVEKNTAERGTDEHGNTDN